MKKIYLVNSDFINSRLDRWFRRVVCQVPQSLIEKSIRSGNIKVNNKKEKSSYKLKNQDQIIVRNINFSPNKQKIVSKKLNNNQNYVLHSHLKNNTLVNISNPFNSKYCRTIRN